MSTSVKRSATRVGRQATASENAVKKLADRLSNFGYQAEQARGPAQAMAQLEEFRFMSTKHIAFVIYLIQNQGGGLGRVRYDLQNGNTTWTSYINDQVLGTEPYRTQFNALDKKLTRPEYAARRDEIAKKHKEELVTYFYTLTINLDLNF